MKTLKLIFSATTEASLPWYNIVIPIIALIVTLVIIGFFLSVSRNSRKSGRRVWIFRIWALHSILYGIVVPVMIITVFIVFSITDFALIRTAMAIALGSFIMAFFTVPTKKLVKYYNYGDPNLREVLLLKDRKMLSPVAKIHGILSDRYYDLLDIYLRMNPEERKEALNKIELRNKKNGERLEKYLVEL